MPAGDKLAQLIVMLFEGWKRDLLAALAALAPPSTEPQEVVAGSAAHPADGVATRSSGTAPQTGSEKGNHHESANS